jgi:hypothetical protein
MELRSSKPELVPQIDGSVFGSSLRKRRSGRVLRGRRAPFIALVARGSNRNALARNLSSSSARFTAPRIFNVLLFPRANAVPPAPFHHSSRSGQKFFARERIPRPFLSVTYNRTFRSFALFFTLARSKSCICHSYAKHPEVYPFIPKFARLPRHDSRMQPGIGIPFPSLQRTAFPIWLLLDLPATRTMDRER